MSKTQQVETLGIDTIQDQLNMIIRHMAPISTTTKPWVVKIEIVISFIYLPYFVLNVLLPSHFLQFLGSAIVATATIVFLRECFSFLRSTDPNKIAPDSTSNFLTHFLLPTYIGMLLIYISDLIVFDKYTQKDFILDFVHLTVSYLGYILIRAFSRRLSLKR